MTDQAGESRIDNINKKWYKSKIKDTNNSAAKKETMEIHMW